MTDKEWMDPENLRQILKNDLYSKADDAMSVEELRDVVDAIERQEPSEAPDVELQWQKFQQYYLSDDALADLILEELPEEPKLVVLDSPAPAQRESIRTHADGKAWKTVKRLIIAAVLTVVMATTVLSAFNINLFSVIAQWTKDIFVFSSDAGGKHVSSSEHDVKREIFDSVEKLCDAKGISIVNFPTYIPHGYKVKEISWTQIGNRDVVYIDYRSGQQGHLFLQYSTIDNTNNLSYEKDGKETCGMTIAGVTYYLMHNLEMEQVVWTVDDMECFIGGDVPREELVNMIESISERIE